MFPRRPEPEYVERMGQKELVEMGSEVGAIRDKWQALGGPQSFLGLPVTDDLEATDGLGRYNHFERGSIYFRPGSGTFALSRAIRDKWLALGGPQSFLGLPITDESKTPDGSGRFTHFERGSIYWSLETGAMEVHGAIRDKWSWLGWERSFLGYPVVDESPTPDGVGRFNHFERGSIYWSPRTGAAEVHGAIRDKWSSLGWERSHLGYPLGDETSTTDGVGRYNHFEGGSIFWSPGTGAAEVHGAIRDKWASLGWERSFLGYPLVDGTPTVDGVGRFNHFERGSIFWSPETGAVEVHGAIRDKWAFLGWERSFLGYPTVDEQALPDGKGRISHFQRGSITWSEATGAVPSVEVVQFHAEIRTDDWLPVGGGVDLVVNTRGDFTFSGRLYNSGFPNVRFALAVVAMTPSGIGYAFGRDGTVDGTVTIFGRERVDEWTETGVRQEFAYNWAQVVQARLHWRLVAFDTLTRGVQGLLEELVEDAAKQLGKAGVAALIAII